MTSGEPLSAERIQQAMAPAARNLLQALTVLDATDSTNAVLLRLEPGQRHAHAVLADSQTRGRGRRQRVWHSPPGGNIYLSLGWRFSAATAQLATLPLVTAVCVCRALERTGLHEHGIKWPNDILVGSSKLAGILVETQSTASRDLLAVVGVGLNVRMPAPPWGMPAASIGRPWTDLASQLRPARRGISRNEVSALLLDELLPGLERYAAEGFGPFRQAWNQRDLLAGKRVGIEGNAPGPSGMIQSGTVLGIDDSGGLSVDLDDVGVQILLAAEVSILDA
jgi:BirA family biotin operon repressor/biotin-[acetyl-CoA-carboxylase] ligase